MIELKQSLAMQERAKERIPGMTQLLSKRPDMFAPGVWPGYFAKAKGAQVWDLDGNVYTDMSIGGIGANVLGYADPDVDAAVRAAVDAGTSCSLNCPEEVALADLLCELHPWADQVRYARTGGEAMAVAVRIARAATGRDVVAFCGYHGWHDWYLAANLGTENALGEHLLTGLEPRGVPQGLAGTAVPFRYNRLDELETILEDNARRVAAIVMEPIRNKQPDAAFLEGVRKLADREDAVLVVDEISAAFRLNTGGAHLLLGLQPDVAVFSKALGNGYPIAAILGKRQVMEAAQSTFISSTYWTERIGPTAALAMIRKHRQADASDHLISMGNLIQAGWRKVAASHGVTIHVGGAPPMSHFTFDDPDAQLMKSFFVQGMLNHGFLASTVFYAMYSHTEQHIADYLVAMDRVFGELASAQAQGRLAEQTKGGPASAGFRRLT